MRKEDILKFLAEGYSGKRQFNTSAMCTLMTELSLSIKKEAKILDLACGSGRVLLPLAKMYPKATFWAYDVSQEMLDQLQKQLDEQSINNVKIIKGNFNKAGWEKVFESECFDLVIMFQSIHFVRRLGAIFKSIKRILKKRGRLVVASTTHEQFYRLPYCKYFETVLKRELARTPDSVEVVDRLSKIKLHIINTINIEISRRFATCQDVRRWLESIPFSVLGYLNKVQLNQGIKELEKHYCKGKKMVIDEFSVMTFENGAIY